MWICQEYKDDKREMYSAKNWLNSKEKQKKIGKECLAQNYVLLFSSYVSKI